ncbi:hypothetical protein QZH41_002158, partial [Actinostola sp. cb2023]
MDQESKEWISKFITYSFDDIANCSVGAIGETILCSAIFAPSCIEGQSKPRLPCRRVCSEYLKRCAATDDEDVDVNWANYLLGLCTLLPNSTASTGECLEPPGFEKYYNSSTTGLLEGGCANLTFPWCQGLNYNHTIAHENVQKNLYKFYYKKNMTGDPVVDAQYDNTTYLHTYDLWMQKFPKCAETIKMMICSGHMPPCFPGEGLAFYTLCSSNCKSILTQCPEIRDSDFYYWLTECEFVAYGNSSHGYCKHTSWPNPHEWLHQKEYFGVNTCANGPSTKRLTFLKGHGKTSSNLKSEEEEDNKLQDAIAVASRRYDSYDSRGLRFGRAMRNK